MFQSLFAYALKTQTFRALIDQAKVKFGVDVLRDLDQIEIWGDLSSLLSSIASAPHKTFGFIKGRLRNQTALALLKRANLTETSAGWGTIYQSSEKATPPFAFIPEGLIFGDLELLRDHQKHSLPQWITRRAKMSSREISWSVKPSRKTTEHFIVTGQPMLAGIRLIKGSVDLTSGLHLQIAVTAHSERLPPLIAASVKSLISSLPPAWSDLTRQITVLAQSDTLVIEASLNSDDVQQQLQLLNELLERQGKLKQIPP